MPSQRWTGRRIPSLTCHLLLHERHPHPPAQHHLGPESARVIIRPFVPTSPQRIATIIGRTLALSDQEVDRELQSVFGEFDSRHFDVASLLMEQFFKVQGHIFTDRPLSRERRLLIGAQFSGEYALESAALFNPSIVPHPDQKDVPAGGLRFIMSLRATGEGHISSIEFREGLLSPEAPSASIRCPVT
nr:hypothetical protein [Verrucomicrobium spinosum]